MTCSGPANQGTYEDRPASGRYRRVDDGHGRLLCELNFDAYLRSAQGLWSYVRTEECFSSVTAFDRMLQPHLMARIRKNDVAAAGNELRELAIE
jgi:hypothetical protein